VRTNSVERDRGSASVELVILAPAVVVLMLFVVFVGRAGGAVEQVRHAADEGARSASLVSRSSMEAAASSAVAADLASNGANCSSTSVSVDVVDGGNVDGGNVAGGNVDSVTVTVTCVVNGVGTELLGAGARSVTASSTEVIDRYRAR
jgi:Flp pilus assembly protein TadG